jgi:hypothetical protein
VGLEDSAHPTVPALAAPEPPRRTAKVRRRRQLEQHWYQCLAYPFLNWSVLLCFALVLSVGMVGVVLSVQNLHLPAFSGMSLLGWLPWIWSVLLVIVIVAYVYATVECALISALAGEGPAFYWPGWRGGFLLKSGVRWLLCFFAGPIVPVGVATYFWLYGGDLTALDWIILTELGVLAVAYWFLAIVSANERNRLRDANPLRVAQLAHRLKSRAVVAVLLAPALSIAHVRLGLFALATMHERLFAGWLLLMGCWCSGLFWAAFLFRSLGVWCYRTPPAHGGDSAEAA